MVSAELRAENSSASASVAKSSSTMKTVIHQLVREDLEKRGSSEKAEPLEIRPENNDVVVLEALIVQEEKHLPEFAAPRESGLAKLLRTGTIKQHVGKKTTVRLWSSGDAGIVLSFRR